MSRIVDQSWRDGLWGSPCRASGSGAIGLSRRAGTTWLYRIWPARPTFLSLSRSTSPKLDRAPGRRRRRHPASPAAPAIFAHAAGELSGCSCYPLSPSPSCGRGATPGGAGRLPVLLALCRSGATGKASPSVVRDLPAPWTQVHRQVDLPPSFS